MSWQLILAGLLLTIPNCLTGIGASFHSRSKEVPEYLTLQQLIDKAGASRTSIQEIKKDVLEPGTSDTDADPVKQTDSPKVNQTDKPPVPGQAQPQVQHPGDGNTGLGSHGTPTSGVLFIVIVAACSVAGLVGLIMAGVCWFKLNRNAKATSDVEYPAYGVSGPNKDRVPSPGDRKLAQSAQMYHYQHQKQQMIAMEKANGEMKHDASEDESEEENEEGDYTVYECPGLAPTGEMEVKNPLFSEDTPVAPGPDDHKDQD
ncbi:neural proliferation differentiation and control protein 1 [Patella vulgata]|uniref:neural proliferation differentiation and control protein 1 n=1 Tax=Patella vulgata TaxID=6465 RepID=UPI0024A921B4|nr:neural proliferation differentiation and control protein 1 [Patella vulgata]